MGHFHPASLEVSVEAVYHPDRIQFEVNDFQHFSKHSSLLLLINSNHGCRRQASVYLQVRREAVLPDFKWMPRREPRGLPESRLHWPPLASGLPLD